MTEVTLRVDGGDVNDARLHQLTASLLKDLRALGLVKVARGEIDAPAGSKSGTAGQIAELVITGLFSASTISTIGKVIIAYVDRTKARSVTWEESDRKVQFTGMSKADQQALTNLLAGHNGTDAEQTKQ
ncbi:MAG TPA: hypothetical protein VGP03_07200 [Pseudonocardiaceae bacterium]|jgi:hypothetical protein|nr:hypothetical protein [Pseudonocardiaceae bacterium]